MQKRTMEGDKPPVTIQELIQVVVLDLKGDGCPHTYISFKAEAAMVSPPDPGGKLPFRLAIRAGNLLMVSKLNDADNRTKDGQFTCQVPDMQYWTWLSSDTLGFVTDNNVYHWVPKEGHGPEKIFSRHQRLEYSEITSYKGCVTGQWYALTGLLPQEDCIAGVTQLFSVSQSISQCITAHVVTFAEYQFDGNQHPSTILCVASRDADSNAGKIHVIELGPHIEGNLAPSCHSDILKLTDEEDRYDFPVALQVASKYRLLYVFTKYGQLYLCDVETATSLICVAISTSIVFSTSLSSFSQGILAVCRKGQVLAVDVKADHLTHHIRNVLGKPLLADKLQRILPPKMKSSRPATKPKPKPKPPPKPKTRAMQLMRHTNCHAST